MEGYFTIFIVLITVISTKHADSSCNFPSNLVGLWESSSRGTLNITSNQLFGYTIRVLGEHVFTCELQEGSKYVLRSESFTESTLSLEALLCIDFEKINNDKYIYYLPMATLPDVENEKVKVVYSGTSVTSSDVCSRPTSEGAFGILLRKGISLSKQSVPCPIVLNNYYSYTLESAGTTSCVNGSRLNGCSENDSLLFDYSLCSTAMIYSRSGHVNCLHSVTDGDVTYVSMYNRDATTDESSTFRMSCMALSNLNGSMVYATQHPQECTESQTSTAVSSPGGAIIFRQLQSTCVLPTKETTIAPVEIPASANLTLPLVLGFLGFLLVLLAILLIGYFATNYLKERAEDAVLEEYARDEREEGFNKVVIHADRGADTQSEFIEMPVKKQDERGYLSEAEDNENEQTCSRQSDYPELSTEVTTFDENRDLEAAMYVNNPNPEDARCCPTPGAVSLGRGNDDVTNSDVSESENNDNDTAKPNPSLHQDTIPAELIMPVSIQITAPDTTQIKESDVDPCSDGHSISHAARDKKIRNDYERYDPKTITEIIEGKPVASNNIKGFVKKKKRLKTKSPEHSSSGDNASTEGVKPLSSDRNTPRGDLDGEDSESRPVMERTHSITKPVKRNTSVHGQSFWNGHSLETPRNQRGLTDIDDMPAKRLPPMKWATPSSTDNNKSRSKMFTTQASGSAVPSGENRGRKSISFAKHGRRAQHHTSEPTRFSNVQKEFTTTKWKELLEDLYPDFKYLSQLKKNEIIDDFNIRGNVNQGLDYLGGVASFWDAQDTLQRPGTSSAQSSPITRRMRPSSTVHPIRKLQTKNNEQSKRPLFARNHTVI